MKALVFADVIDPWSYIGATRFERAAATFTIVTGHPIDISFRALVTDDESLSLGEQDLASAAARITGIDLNMAEVVPASSFDAWRVLTWAGESGPGVQRWSLPSRWQWPLSKHPHSATSLLPRWRLSRRGRMESRQGWWPTSA